jgi:iron only hydrogenase large subunit-like protein
VKKIYGGELKNGIRYVVADLPWLHSVSVNVGLEIGSRFEEKNEEGLSHFLEHLAFKGTNKRPSGEIVNRELDEKGAEYNAETSWESTEYYLTTTEVSMMIKENKIDFKNIRLSEFDKLMGKSSSSGVIFGSTGGVTESVLRAVSYLNGKSEDKNTCEVIRDTKDFKEVSVSIGSMKLKVLVVYGLKNAKEVLDKIKNKTVKYDFVEVMSCPMGCVGGAGNKLSNINKLDEVRDMRKDLLNLFDSEMIVKNCFQNKEMMKLFNGYLNKERIKNYLHTSFSKKSLTK